MNSAQSQPRYAPPSPPTERVLSVLNLLATEPSTRLLLADITRAAGLSQATCVRVLDTLCQHGYVSRRQADKSYGLGPALIALGDAARAGFGPLEVARPLMEEMRAELGVPWTASAVVGDRIVVLDRSSDPGGRAALTRPGTRYPFAPPSGVIFVAWDTDDAIAEWLARPPLVTAELDRALFAEVVASCRSRGYVVERLSESTSIADSLLAGIVNNDLPSSVQEALNRAVSILGNRDYLVAELDRPADLPVGNIASPVFDADGRPLLLLGLVVYQERLSTKDIRRYAQGLVGVSTRVTEALGGHNPW